MNNNLKCALCTSLNLSEVNGYPDLIRITSDCRPYAVGGRLAVCIDCGLVQKLLTTQLSDECSDIYSNYAVYYQGSGDEQIVFDIKSGRIRRRSDVLVDFLSSHKFHKSGRLLDVGCGNGATLNSLSKSNFFSDWDLYGFEVGNTHLETLTKIPNFKHLYTDSINNIDANFDLVTMIHSLEHFPTLDILEDIRKINLSGFLFIEVCNVEENPFDILVADHIFHFSPLTLLALIKKIGYHPLNCKANLIKKEISLLMSTDNLLNFYNNQDLQERDNDHYGLKTFEKITSYVSWLHKLREQAELLQVKNRAFGIFGTSLASTWVASQLHENVSFFVDEDISRIGRFHLGAPIFSPNDIPSHSVVLIPLAPSIANAIYSRLTQSSQSGYKLVLPPKLDF